MSHTPGPWEVDDSGTVTAANGAHIAAVSNLDDFPCADADGMHPEQREDVEAEYRANATLIASAPALLKALELAWDLLVVQPDLKRVAGFKTMAEAALARAKGSRVS